MPNFVLVALAMSLGACAPKYVDQNTKGISQANDNIVKSDVGYKIHQRAWTPSPSCVILMPLKAKGVDINNLSLVRSGLYAHLDPKGYIIPSFSEIDTLIATSDNINMTKIGESLKCDYVMEGEVSEFNSDFYLIYSEVNIGANLLLRRISDKKILWESSYTASLKDGGLPLSPLGATSSVFLASRNMTDEKTFRTVDILSRHLMNTLPDSNTTSRSVGKDKDLSWRDNIDNWLHSIPEIDREARLEALVQREDLTELQSELVYNRLTSISEKPHHYIQWIELKIKNGKYDSAIEILDTRFRDSKNPKVWYLLGRALSGTGRFYEADKKLVYAISINKGNLEYYNALAHVSSKIGNTDKARAAYKMGLNIDDNQPFTWYNIAIIDFNSGNYRNALNSFLRAGEIYKKQGLIDKVNKIVKDLDDLRPFVGARYIDEVRDVLKKE